MIIRIEGRFVRKGDDHLVVDVRGMHYQILAAPITLEKVEGVVDEKNTVSLITYHYLQQDRVKAVPVLIGFVNDIEKDFFERFITVSGIGPKAALRALNQPISSIARFIDDGDVAALCRLPGIGRQRAREIVAKLQGKVGKYGLIRDEEFVVDADKHPDRLRQEALDVLLQLQYRRNEARDMIEAALKRSPRIATAEDLLNEVYKHKK
ncbi:MAG: Holliday junction branch migration protein RuvA [Candidatus Omnitrophota bacterium]